MGSWNGLGENSSSSRGRGSSLVGFNPGVGMPQRSGPKTRPGAGRAVPGCSQGVKMLLRAQKCRERQPRREFSHHDPRPKPGIPLELFLSPQGAAAVGGLGFWGVFGMEGQCPRGWSPGPAALGAPAGKKLPWDLCQKWGFGLKGIVGH